MANNVVRATLIGSPLAVCGTGAQGHVGSYRIKGRVWASAPGQYIRLAWSDGDGPFRANPYVTPPVTGAFSEVDLGLINIPPKQLGTQRWQGRIEAYTTGAAGVDTLDVDYLVFIPVGEFYGKVRAEVVADTPTALSGRDEFAQTAGALNAKTAAVGGNWATSGDATDLSVTGSGAVTRTTTSDATWGRNAVLGTTTYTDTAARIDAKRSGGVVEHGLLLRYVDASNYCHIRASITGSEVTIEADKVIAGGHTNPPGGFVQLAVPPFNEWRTLQAAIDTSGNVFVWWAAQGQVKGAPTLVTQDATLATGGTLASGKVGFMDLNPIATASTRTYDNFAAWVPTLPVAIYSGRVAEIRFDGAKRQDSTGVYYGDMPAYRGGRFRVPPAGDENRTSRILVKAHRNDIEASDSANVTDNLTIQMIITPRGVVAPF